HQLHQAGIRIRHSAGGQKLAGLLIFITDIHALGLKTVPIFQQPQGYIFGYEANLPIDYDLRLCYKLRQPRSLRACSRDDPECGARRGVLRRRLVTARPGRPGKSPARHYDLAARSSLYARVMPETEARPRVKNRHGGAPRGERPALWDARRLARRLACRVTCTPHGCSAEHPNVSRRSAHPRLGVSEAKLQTPDADMRRGNEMGCLTP